MSIPTPAIPLMAADELSRLLIETLRGDAHLANYLFPAYATSQGPTDYRVFGSSPDLAEGPTARSTLPRITIECVGTAFATEQEAARPRDGEVNVYVHILVEKGHEDEVAFIEAITNALLLSTSLSSVRIIAAGLSYVGQGRRGRVPSFNDAWEAVTQFRSPHVGVIA